MAMLGLMSLWAPSKLLVAWCITEFRSGADYDVYEPLALGPMIFYIHGARFYGPMDSVSFRPTYMWHFI